MHLPTLSPRPTRARRARAAALPLLLALAAASGACAGGAAPETAPAPASGAGGAAAGTGGATAAQPAQPWRLATREHVDLWLHGFALLLDDTARVPIFRRGYREELRALRSRGNVYTQLDAERDRLRQRFATNGQLALSAQFVALPFDSWDELRRAAQLLVDAQGDPRRVSDRALQPAVAYLAQSFPSAADREWLRVFIAALADESDRFFHQHWLAAQRERNATLAAADSVWQRVARPRLQRFLNNTQQPDGTLVPSLPIGGEGRATGGSQGMVVVALPPRGGDPAIPSYVAAHEAVGSLVGAVVGDNVTPADQRAGLADRYVSAGQVRGGLVLLQRTVPTLAAGYARYYLAQAGLPATNDPAAALVAAFPLPAPIADAIGRQVDVTLGGI